jgi:hypothetical protein
LGVWEARLANQKSFFKLLMRDNAAQRKEFQQKSSRKICKKLGVHVRTHAFASKASVLS